MMRSTEAAAPIVASGRLRLPLSGNTLFLGGVQIRAEMVATYVCQALDEEHPLGRDTAPLGHSFASDSDGTR